MSRRTLLVAIVSIGMVLGCGDRDSPVEPSEIVTEPSFDFMNGPFNPGNSGVYRIVDPNGNFAWVWASGDPAGDFWAYHFQSDDWGDLFGLNCGGSADISPWDIQLVTNPQEVHDALHVLGSAGDIPVVIYRFSEAPAPGEECDHLQNNWLYKGTHKIRYNDNDFTLDGPGGNSFSFKAQGIVYDPDGAPHRYTENQHALYGPENDFRGWKTEFIRVHPIGGN